MIIVNKKMERPPLKGVGVWGWGEGGGGTPSDLLSRKTSPALIKSGRDRRGGRSRWERSEARDSGRLPAGAVFEMQGLDWTRPGADEVWR